jgi:hypothetical protein
LALVPHATTKRDTTAFLAAQLVSRLSSPDKSRFKLFGFVPHTCQGQTGELHISMV